MISMKGSVNPYYYMSRYGVTSLSLRLPDTEPVPTTVTSISLPYSNSVHNLRLSCSERSHSPLTVVRTDPLNPT